MDIYEEEAEYSVAHLPMFQKVVDMFEGRPGFQGVLKRGILANMGFGVIGGDSDSDSEYDFGPWSPGLSSVCGCSLVSHGSCGGGLQGNHAQPFRSHHHHQHHHHAEHPHPTSVKVQARESDSERRARLIQEAKKSKEKADKKRLKKEKQKERKRSEKEKQNPLKNEEEKDDAQQCNADETVDDESKSSLASAKANDSDSTDGSEDDSSDVGGDAKNDSEELDMTSTFVSKAALIARRKIEQKPRPERKTPVKDDPKSSPDKPKEEPQVEKKVKYFAQKDTASSLTAEDNIKTSADLANIGNNFAKSGDFKMAVKYFTDAIKHNPTEFKLFGNRSFCFEKMQEYTKALADAELSLSMSPGWVKGLFRKGRALAGLKRYEEASQAFKEVLKEDGRGTFHEAAKELQKMRAAQLLEYGFPPEQCINASKVCGSVKEAAEFLTKLNQLKITQIGESPVLSANRSPAPQFQDEKKPLGPVQNMSYVKSKPKPVHNEYTHPPQELFPVWVGNLINPVTEAMLTDLFDRVGVVSSVKILSYKRCAFVNYMNQDHCEEAIRHFHGNMLNGNRIAVRYPDRIPQGMGISRSAIIAEDMTDLEGFYLEHRRDDVARHTRRYKPPLSF